MVHPVGELSLPLDGPRLVLSTEMRNSKPFVSVAAFCEKVLEDRDGVLSAIRLVDTFELAAHPSTFGDLRPGIEVSGIIALKSGPLVGSYTVGLVMENTKGERKEISPAGGWPVVFNGGEHGIQIRLNFYFEVREVGLWWFDVMFENEVLTRIPLKLRVREEQQPGETPQN